MKQNAVFSNAFLSSGLSLIVNFSKQNSKSSETLRMMTSLAFTSHVTKPFITPPSPSDFHFPWFNLKKILIVATEQHAY